MDSHCKLDPESQKNGCLQSYKHFKFNGFLSIIIFYILNINFFSFMYFKYIDFDFKDFNLKFKLKCGNLSFDFENQIEDGDFICFNLIFKLKS